MQAHTIHNMFNFHFRKSSDVITEKMRNKATQLRAKIEERKVRVQRLREEYKITDAVLIDLLEQAREAARKGDVAKMSYSVSNSQHSPKGMQDDNFTIGAGVVNNLLTEGDFIKSEEAAVRKLELIARNLQDDEDENGKKVGHVLRQEEAEYLGF